jgi:hypothetical protein
MIESILRYFKGELLLYLEVNAPAFTIITFQIEQYLQHSFQTNKHINQLYTWQLAKQ